MTQRAIDTLRRLFRRPAFRRETRIDGHVRAAQREEAWYAPALDNYPQSKERQAQRGHARELRNE